MNELVSTFKLRDDSNKKDKKDHDRRPDVTGYAFESLHEAWRWVFMELWAEFKRLASMDPFHQDYKNTDRLPDKDTSEDAHKCLGQLTLYAASQLSRQHRTFIISLLICGDHARFLRFDRSGAIVTKHFNYRTKPHILAEFFYRYDHMSAFQRGFDPTAVRAKPHEQQLLEDTIDAYTKDESKRQVPGMELIPKSDYPCYVMTVTDTSDPAKKKESRKYIVKMPLVEIYSSVGRSTRGYVALQISTVELVFVKDYWRPAGFEDRPSEAAIYVALKKANVPHLPVVRLAGDVPADKLKFQETLTQQWANQEGLHRSSSTLRVYRHHRIVQDLAFPLSTAKNSKEATAAVRNVLRCMCDEISLLALVANRVLYRHSESA